ncbi:MAG: MotA/TolQ/ExbB proton channel family protein [Rubripirellula sp.]
MNRNSEFRFKRCCVVVLASLMVLLAWMEASYSGAQESPVPIDASDIQEVMNDEAVEDTATPPSSPSGIDLLTLIARGGAFMIPIAIMSLMVVTLAFERLVSLRLSKVLPSGLAEELEDLSDPIERFSPAAAYESCAEYPSPASRVIKSMLMRTGQPLAEIERAAHETIEREADQQASPIRWLTLAAAATPLMGLLGTVWGMIVAFHESTSLTADRSRSEQLSEGIYTALVTTLSGLVVAIPAAILALYLENRLAKLFHRIEEFAFQIAPALGPFVGRQRLDADGVLQPMDRSRSTIAETPPPPPPPRSAKDARGDVKAG